MGKGGENSALRVSVHELLQRHAGGNNSDGTVFNEGKRLLPDSTSAAGGLGCQPFITVVALLNEMDVI